MVDGKMNNLNILYEDNHIIVVEKKPNILSQSDITGDKDLLTMVKEYVKEKYNKPGNVYIGLVHRLDRVVGGIMVFARTSKAAKRLNKQIKNHEFKKSYIAVCDGIIKSDGVLTNYLYKDPKKHVSIVVNKDHKDAKLCKLEYEVVSHMNNKTVLKINLITGRYNQIRVQFNNINHPLDGDFKYNKNALKGSSKQIKLWAYKIEFNHPVTKEKLSFKLLPNWEEVKNEELIHRL